MKEIIIQGMSVYVETDKDGYVSFSTDGFHPVHHKATIDTIIGALRSVQTEEDRESEEIFRQHNLRQRIR